MIATQLFVFELMEGNGHILGGWFPGPFLDETFEAFEAFEGPRVEGGGGGAAEGEEGFEGEDEGFEAPFKAFEGFEAFEGEDEGTFEAFEAPFRVSNKPNETHTETLLVA